MGMGLGRCGRGGYPRQKAGMNSTKTANNSRRPSNMPSVKIHFAASLSGAKLPEGPITSPNPGPIFAKAVAAPDTEVTKSSPVNPKATAKIPNNTKNSTKNPMTEERTSAETGRPSNRGSKTPWGADKRRTWVEMDSSKIW